MAEEKKKTEVSNKLTGDGKEIMDLIEKMKVVELNDLVKALENKFGVSATAPVMSGAESAAGASEATPAEEQDEFDVILTGAGENKIAVIKAVRTIDQTLGLVEAKTLVESAPKTILEGAKKEDANEAKKKLEEAGAKVELK